MIIEPDQKRIKPELSRIVDAATLDADVRRITVRATPEECVAVATRLLVPAVASLVAEFSLSRRDDDLIKLEGHASADIVLLCSVALEEFETQLSTDIECLFSHRSIKQDDAAFDPDEIDVEAYDGKRLDVGDIAVEELALAIPAFPRGPKADAILSGVNDAGAGELDVEEALPEGRQRPFGNLEAMLNEHGSAADTDDNDPTAEANGAKH